MSKVMSKFISVALVASAFLSFSTNSFSKEVKEVEEELILSEDEKSPDIIKKETKPAKKVEKKEADDELDALLNSDINAGDTGSFGALLNEFTKDMGIEPYIHAYTTFDAMKVNDKPFTFDSRYYNLFLGVNIKDVISSELQIENEHSGTEYEVRVGQVDLLLNPLFNFRVGRFLVPIGTFNSYLYPEYITKGVDRPFALREIIPVTWSDNGVEIFGKYEFGINKNVNYTLYAINGLKQGGTVKDSDSVADGGGIRAMRGNVVENDKSDKGLGARFGISPLDGLEVSLSGYSGSYTADAAKRLSMGDVDVAFEKGNFNFRGEYVYALQQAKAGDITKHGGYGQLSYLFKPVEPVVRFDLINFSNDIKQNRQRVLVGVNYYPFYDIYKKLVMKVAYTYTMQQELKDPNGFYFQTSLGF